MRNVVLLGLILALPLAAAADADWAEWRGPTANGVSPAKEAPLNWSAAENVQWKFALPNGSGATPIVYGGRIYLTGVKDGTNVVFCLDRDGQLQWETKLGPAADTKHRKKGSASHPSGCRG